MLVLLVLAGCAAESPPLTVRPSPSSTLAPTVRDLPSNENALTAIELLECDAAPSTVGGVGREMAFEGGGGGATPEDALAAFLGSSAFVIPTGPYEPIGSTGDRFAYGFRAESQVKVVAVVSSRFADDVGAAFVLDELRTCDESEFGSEAGFADGRRVWTHVDSGAILTDIVGPGHCGWQSARILHVIAPDDSIKQYVRDPEGVLGVPLRDSYAADLDAVPDDAGDSGYRTADGGELWFTESDRAAYVVLGDAIERWPRTTDVIGCS